MDDLNINHACFNAETPVGVSDKYKFVSTRRFVEDLESLGFQLKSFYGPRQGLGFHQMEFTNTQLPSLEGIDMRLYATNSHNGSSAFRLGIAMLRQVCTNGMIGMRRDEEAAVRHVGYARSYVKAALETTLTKFDHVIDTVKLMQHTTLPTDLTAQFVVAASKLRSVTPHRAEEFLAIRRQADQGTDLWTVFNRVQESLIRGGYKTSVPREVYDYNQRKSIIVPGEFVPGPKARELTAVKERLNVNQKLWTLAQEYLNRG